MAVELPKDLQGSKEIAYLKSLGNEGKKLLAQMVEDNLSSKEILDRIQEIKEDMDQLN